MRYSCRAVVGHGQKCEPNYQCDACAAKQKYIPRIEKLEAALRKIADIEHEDLPKPAGAAEGTLWAILAGCVEVARKALEKKDDPST